MRKKQTKGFGVFLLAASMAWCVAGCGSDSGGGAEGMGENATVTEQEGSYAAYIQQYQNIPFGEQEIVLRAKDFIPQPGAAPGWRSIDSRDGSG